MNHTIPRRPKTSISTTFNDGGSKTTILITGANIGIGFEIAAQMMMKGSYPVLIRSRSSDKGNSAAEELYTRQKDAAEAGLNIPLQEQMRLYFDTNATCPAVVTSVFARLLKKSTSPRIVNITSGRGSIERRLDSSDPGYVLLAIPYRASKVDLNMVSACHFVEHEAQGIKVLLYNLGLTMSNLGQINKPEGSAKPTSQAGNLWLRS